MIDAEKARKIANSELLQIIHKIEECAYDGGLQLLLGYSLKKETIDTLRDYGYKVYFRKDPIYDETPYGTVLGEPTGFLTQIKITWDENTNNS
jgi:hypothetical protein